jgi:hypothetical protein
MKKIMIEIALLVLISSCDYNKTGPTATPTPSEDDMGIWEEVPSPPEVQITLGGQTIALTAINYDWTWNSGSGPQNLSADSRHPLEMDLPTIENDGGALGISSPYPPSNYYIRYWELNADTQNAVSAENADYYETSYKNIESVDGIIRVPDSEYEIVLEIAATWEASDESNQMGEAHYAFKCL